MIATKPLSEAKVLVVGAGDLVNQITRYFGASGVSHITVLDELTFENGTGACSFKKADPMDLLQTDSNFFKSFDIVLCANQPRPFELGVSKLRWSKDETEPELPMMVMRSVENNCKMRCQYNELKVNGKQTSKFVSLPMDLLPWTDEKRELVVSTIKEKFRLEQDQTFLPYFLAANAFVEFQQSKGAWPTVEDEQHIQSTAGKSGNGSQSDIQKFVRLFCEKGLAAAPETISILAHLIVTDAIKLLTGNGQPINNTNLDDVITIVTKTLQTPAAATPPSGNFHQVSSSILDHQNPCSPLSVPAPQTALLLLDFHKFILASQPNQGQEVLSAASSLRSWAKTRNIMIIHCLIDLKATTPPHLKMAQRVNGARDKFGRSPDLSGEPSSIAAVADEYVFYRPPSHVSAMGSYGLELFLEQHNIQSLLLAGFSSSGCVINTAKGAADKGFIVTAVRDACGDKSEEVQGVVMEGLLVGQCHVVEREMLVEAWEKGTTHGGISGLVDKVAETLRV